MLWAESERVRLLEGAGLVRRVDDDLARIKEDLTTLVQPFMQKYQHCFRSLRSCYRKFCWEVVLIITDDKSVFLGALITQASFLLYVY